MNIGSKLILFLLVISLAAACRTNRSIPRKDRQAVTDEAPRYSGAEGKVKYPQSLKLRKAAIKLSLNGKEELANASIGIIRDSIIVVSVVPVAGIEVVRIYLTKDKLTVINRQDKTYSHSAITVIREKYNLAIVYKDIQAVLLNELFLYGDYERADYQVNEVNVDDQSRLVEYRIRKGTKENINQQVYFSRELDLLEKVNITDIKREVILMVEYEDFINVQEIKFPRMINVNIENPGNMIDIQIGAKKIQFDEEVRIREIIPDGYKRIQL